MKNYDRGLESATSRGQHFQAQGHSFLPYRPTPNRSITFYLFSCSKLAYKWVCLANFVVELAYAPSTYRDRANNPDTRQNNVFKNTQDYAPLQRRATKNQTNSHNFKKLSWIHLR